MLDSREGAPLRFADATYLGLSLEPVLGMPTPDGFSGLRAVDVAIVSPDFKLVLEAGCFH